MRWSALISRLRTPSGIAIAVSLVFGLAMGMVPGFGGPGYEIALVTGIVMPSVVAIATAIELGRRDDAPFELLARGASIGALATVATFVATSIHGLRNGFCDPLSGYEIVALGPGIGLVVAGAWGWAASELARFLPDRGARARLRRVARVVFALAGPLGGIAVSLARYYTSPIIFAYDPFAGYFSGTIYDTVLDYGTLGTYRLGTAATAVATIVVAIHLRRTERGHARPALIGRPGLLAIGVVAALASAIVTASGPRLGHWNTRASIEEELGGRIEGDRCLVVYARSLRPERVRRFAAECEAHVALVESWWGARGPEKITAFLFSGEGEKARLMGASGTNVAKPWRAEVYVQDMDFPHRVVGHELMHVVAASDGQGPFRVAGSWGGYLPNPGLIEGVAVAASPKEDDLSPMEWAKAMKDLEILPRLSQLFTLGFLGENSSMAYTVSGAFVGWIHDEYGAEVVRRWYGGEALESLTHKSLADLEADWHVALDRIALAEAAKVQAKARFDRPGFFARRCPRIVDQCREQADVMASSGDIDGALEQLARARSFDPDNPSLRLEEASALVAGTEREKGLALYETIANDPNAPAFARDRAIEALGDQALKFGDVDAARARYESVLPRIIDEAKLRTLYVKLRATEDAELRVAIVTLLLGVGRQEPDRTAAAALLGTIDRDRPNDGLAAYLLARHFVDAGSYETASAHLDRALSRTITVPRVRIEALRLRILSAVAIADCPAAAKTLVDYEREPDVSPSRVDFARSLVALCEAYPAAR
ncbi:MAG: hypothetical protein HOW73_39415 [Polyangiaceae bacterium]|nr:hypothetical protein [Polyangiaceae bacterium]